jgi:hypothetical protein
MKRILLPLSLLAVSLLSNAQEVLHVQNGAVITVQNGAQFTVLGGVSLANGSTLTNNGTITVKGNGAAGSGDWADASSTPYNHGTGTIVFNRTGGVQSISSENTFERLEINNGGLNLASNIRSNHWRLINGPVNTGTFLAIAQNTSAAAIEAGAGNTNFGLSWINGNLRRHIAPASVNNYAFPLGNATRSNVAELDNLMAMPLTGVTYIDAFFAPKLGSDAGLVVTEGGSVYTSIHDGGIWHLNPDAQPGSGRYNLKLYFNGFAGLQDNTFTILRRAEGSSSGADWSVPTGSAVNSNGGVGRVTAGGFAQRNNIGAFSEFGLGILSAPLPVTFTRFDANRLNKVKVNLTWETATEQNNKGFFIERRLDNETVFTSKDFVPSTAPDGNSANPINYRYLDPNGYGGISYYRLKQVDLDNRAHYSLIKAVSGIGETTVSVMIWPNPNQGQFSIKIDGVTESKEAAIIDITGKTVQRLVLQASTQVNVRGLSQGTYILSIPNAFGKGGNFTEKIIVVR